MPLGIYIYIQCVCAYMCVCACHICKYRVPHHSHWWWPFHPKILGQPAPSHEPVQCHLLNESPCLAIFKEPGFPGSGHRRQTYAGNFSVFANWLNCWMHSSWIIGSGSGYWFATKNAMATPRKIRAHLSGPWQWNGACPRVLPPADPCRALEVMACRLVSAWCLCARASTTHIETWFPNN